MYKKLTCAIVIMEVLPMDIALITQLKILKLSDTKSNFSELSRIYGIDRRTIKKYYDGYEGKPEHHNKPSTLDKHKDLIKNKLAIKGSTAKAVYEFILSEVDTDIGTYSNFTKYIKANDLQPRKNVKGHPRYETAPGIQAQVDWKEDVSIANKFGEIFTFQVFDYKLGHSRYCHFTYKLYKTRQDVFDCLIASFIATGGVPKEILFDNMASVVDLKCNHRHINDKMRAFAKDFNFKIKLCKPRHPYTKGKPVSIQVTPDKLFIYYNMEIIAEHHLSSKRLNYQKEHYKNLLSYCVDDVNTVAEMAEDNLRQMDDFL